MVQLGLPLICQVAAPGESWSFPLPQDWLQLSAVSPAPSFLRSFIPSNSLTVTCQLAASVLPPVSSAAPTSITLPPGDPPLTLDQVTPPIAPAGPLPPSEAATVALFERTTYSVVNIFDTALRPQLNTTGSVEVHCRSPSFSVPHSFLLLYV